MKRNTFMSIAAIVAALFGLAFLLIPTQFMTLYGVNLDPSGEYIGRYLGSAFLGIGVLTWYAKGAPKDNEALQAILLGGFVLCLTGFVASVFDALYGVGNSAVWSTVVIYLLLGLGFGFYKFQK